MPAAADPAETDAVVAVGNDIVALNGEGAAGKAADRRFMDRVFTPAERSLIGGAENPDAALWSLWAAKETAFKIAVKIQPGVIFSPRAFSVLPHGDPQSERFRSGTVTYGELRCAVAWSFGPGWVHCIGIGGVGTDAADTPSAVPSDLTAAVRPAEGSESVGVRLLAADLLAGRGFAGARILRTRTGPHEYSPPYAERNGVVLDRDISLSHDGGLVAAVIGPPGSSPRYRTRAAL